MGNSNSLLLTVWNKAIFMHSLMKQVYDEEVFKKVDGKCIL